LLDFIVWGEYLVGISMAPASEGKEKKKRRDRGGAQRRLVITALGAGRGEKEGEKKRFPMAIK